MMDFIPQSIKQSKVVDFYAGKALSWGLVGVAGTGKTVLSVIYIVQNIHKFEILATNIKGFDYELLKKATGCEFKYIELDYTKDSLVKHMQYLNEINKDLTEDNRITSLNVVDECHKIFRFFSNKELDEIYISDFLSETRHKGPAYWILLTQNFKKIHNMYRNDVAFWFQTQQDELKTNSENIHFKKFDSELDTRIQGQDVVLNRYKDTKFTGVDGKEYSYFDFYVSGDGGRQIHKSKSMIAKKIFQVKLLIISIIFLVVFSIYKFYSSSLISASETQVDKNTTNIPIVTNTIVQKNSNNIENNNTVNLNFTDKVLIKILYKNGNYFFGDVKFSEKQFQVLKKELDIFILTRQTIFNQYEYLFCFFTKESAISFGLYKDTSNEQQNNLKKMN